MLFSVYFVSLGFLCLMCVCDDLVIYICSMIFSDRYLASMYSICIYMCLCDI